MAHCVFCGRHFRNKQSVRAHLKWCDWYARREVRERDEVHHVLPAADAPMSAEMIRVLDLPSPGGPPHGSGGGW